MIDHFRADTKLARLQNIGHLNRHGHPITGYYVTNDGIRRLVRICCGEHKNREA